MKDLITYSENPTARAACALVLDTSSSMYGEPINALNAAVRQFFTELLGDDFARFAVEPAIYTFGGAVNRQQGFTSLATVDSYTGSDFFANGGTPMGQALETAMNDLEGQKAFYKKGGTPYYQPWLVLITDGAPTDHWQAAAQRLRALADERKVVVVGVFVGSDEGGYQTLAQICPANRPPKRLAGLKFKEFFQWLSASMKSVSRSSPGDNIKLPPTSGWDTI